MLALFCFLRKVVKMVILGFISMKLVFENAENLLGVSYMNFSQRFHSYETCKNWLKNCRKRGYFVSKMGYFVVFLSNFLVTFITMKPPILLNKKNNNIYNA